MATSTVQPSSNTKLSQSLDSKINSTHLRDASFSAYLSTTEENIVLKLAESYQNPCVDITPTEETLGPASLGRTKTQKGEISVFGAEKYFNMRMDEDDYPRPTDSSARKGWHKKDDRVNLRSVRPGIRAGTPSASSEASWNSQNPLLSSFMRNPSHSKQKKAIGSRFLTGFGCNGSCYNDKSVYIDENVARGGVHGKEVRKKAIQVDLNPIMLDRTKHFPPGFQPKDELKCPSFERMSVGFQREENFAFPILNSGLPNSTVLGQLEEVKAEDARISLEVFGSHTMKRGDIAVNLERKLSVLTWDAIPKAQTLPTTSRSSGMCEDMESDASSDLFEIENISGSGHPLFTRQASDGMSSCMTGTTLYAPSEASIEWSVVTASAADFSAVSDCGEKKPADELNSTPRINKMGKTKPVMGKEAPKSRPSGLLGCKNHKAVGIAETAHRTNEKVKYSDPSWHQKPLSSMPIKK
ncbi:hypothetical protein L1049_027975 [Liquidambar formosana]|uniref:Uncharacterized protein n=1 Tax=Liquidambar formosana TaxID=63359 RepID=A0AAP0WW81_LIQFO